MLPALGSHPGLDRLSGLAAQLLRAPAAQVSLLTDVQTVAGGAGLPAGAVGSQGALTDSLCTVTAALGGPLVVPDARADSRVAALPPVVTGQVASYLGVPLVADDGQTVGALCVFDPVPRPWTDADVAVLAQLAASAVAELELAALANEYEASRVAWELAVRAGGIGTFDWDLGSGTLRWDDRLVELFGYDTATFTQSIEAFNARLHPDDLPRVTAALQQAIDCCGEYEADYRVVLPDGTVRWVAARGRALGDAAGMATRVLGTAYDITARQEGEARVTRVLEAMSAAFYSLDRDWRFTYVNAEAERLLGRPRGELLGGSIWELFPAAVGSDFEASYRRASASGEHVTFEAYYPEPLNGWYEVRVWPSGEGIAVYFLEITARRAAQEQAHRAAVRAELLGEVTAELAETLDPEQAVARLAELVVPALADWCLVTLVDDDEHAGARRGLRDVGWAHVDPSLEPLVARYAGLRLEALLDNSFVHRALRTGRPIGAATGAAAAIRRVLRPGEAYELLGELAPESFTVLPLRGRGRTVGLLSLFNGAARGRFAPDDLATAGEVAGRAGLALDNARLYRQQRRVAEELQRAMLTAPPEPDHMQVVVRYSPAAEATQVGGDWYDAFVQPDGATVLVIGDVIGHDVVAAAAMGQVRGIVRTVGAEGSDSPAEILRRADRVMHTLQVGTTATAVVARLEQTADERARGVSRLRWSNAGHPPPMVVNPDGTVVPLVGLEADLLLGIMPDAQRVESEVTVDRGSTVLLYTDGLVERRGQSLDAGLVQLRDTLAALAAEGVGLDELCDRALARMLPRQPEDDVALVAVRLHRQDRPRPVEAGPNRVPPFLDPEP
ncbi:SpoIIE family protein phosphatase [Motilibacter sp. K478]|nr:SpoIIE family protein phosphatase [Motilibacter aurantiacus]